ncbi:MAG: PQQ-dependent sugar dehydrogenase, partial [Acidobacteriota bacterium]
RFGRLWRWALLASALFGVALLQLSVVADALGIGYPGFGLSQKVGAALGSTIALAAYLLYRRFYGDRSGRGRWRSLVIALEILLLPVAMLYATLGALAVSSQLERHRLTLQAADLRLLDLEEDLARLSRSSQEGCAESQEQATGVALHRVVSGLSKPVFAIHSPIDPSRMLVVEKAGTIRVVVEGQVLPEPFLDLRDQTLSEDSQPPGHLEQGLFSLAFHPDYSANGRFFLTYTAQSDGALRVAEFHRRSNAEIGDPASQRILLSVEQPFPQHNAGHVVFGPDGYLYIGSGDGGFDMSDIVDDPENSAQDHGSWLGKLLRIDVNGEPAPGLAYAIPASNPFRHAPPGARPEIFALGFRNPWRFEFDPCDGRLFLGDVGRSTWEEIDLVVRGANYGWKPMEGSHDFPAEVTHDPTGFQRPVHEYGHPWLDPQGGISIIGGYVYRGRELPQLAGQYLFADAYYGRLWTLRRPLSTWDAWRSDLLLQTELYISSFGQSPDGEIYVVAYGSGEIYRLVAAP